MKHPQHSPKTRYQPLSKACRVESYEGRALTRRGRLLAWVVGCLLLAWATPGLAVDGGVEFRNDTQSGTIGPAQFDTDLRRERIFLRQLIPFSQSLSLNAEYHWQKYLTGSSFGGVRLESDRLTNLGRLTFSFRRRAFTLGARGSVFAENFTTAGLSTAELNRQQYEGWFQFQPWGDTRLWANYTKRFVERRGGVAQGGDIEEDLGTLDLRQNLKKAGMATYRFNTLSYDATVMHVERSQRSHLLEYQNAVKFAKRADANLRVRTTFFDQTLKSGSSDEGRLLLLPIRGGFILDDTPEEQDPLEGTVTQVVELYDQDRETGTIVDIGDATPPVREFGGDYRNVQFDLGGVEELSAAFLYVDTRLVQPQLLQWRIFISNEPEGQFWTELGSEQVTTVYQEWGNGLQGWEVLFSETVPARHFKMVNVKFGLTEPTILVTEMEVYTSTVGEVRSTDAHSEDYRVDAGLGTYITSTVDVRYDTMWRERKNFGFSRDYHERRHGLMSRWRPGRYQFTVQYRISQLEVGEIRNTDLTQYQASAARGMGTPLTIRLAWNHTTDKGLGQTIDNDIGSLTGDWRASPGLRFSQKFSYGLQQQRVTSTRTRSYASITSIDTRPFPNLTLMLDRNDRWVDNALGVGVGFQNFNDSGLRTTWAPVPFISLSSTVRYMVRQYTQWTVRNYATWFPFSGEKVEFLLSANYFYESNIPSSQKGVTAGATWKPAARLTVEGNVSYQHFDRAGVKRDPTSTTVHVIWTF